MPNEAAEIPQQTPQNALSILRRTSLSAPFAAQRLLPQLHRNARLCYARAGEYRTGGPAAKLIAASSPLPGTGRKHAIRRLGQIIAYGFLNNGSGSAETTPGYCNTTRRVTSCPPATRTRRKYSPGRRPCVSSVVTLLTVVVRSSSKRPAISNKRICSS
jgi:hypothetical protein